MKHPAVAEVAVIGVPDEKWGNLVRAVVHLKPGMKASEEDIKEHCRRHVARYQVPKSVVFAASLPREVAYGKISRQEYSGCMVAASLPHQIYLLP